jgi:putative membrane protein
VYDEGTEPDPRFTLANERTFLAQLRTALALFAGALALEALSLPASTHWRAAGACVFVVLGMATAVQAWFGWAATERALRRHQPLPAPTLGPALSVGIVLGAAVVVVGMAR